MLYLQELPTRLSTDKIDSDSENGSLSKRDHRILTEFSNTVTNILGKDEAYKVPFIGGVGLRLLEKATGLSDQDIFSGFDIDAFYCDTDEDQLQSLRHATRDLSIPQTDIHRFLRKNEAKKPIPPKFILDEYGELSSSMLRGHIQHNVVEPFEIIGVPIDNDHTAYTISPAISFHMYALRAIMKWI